MVSKSKRKGAKEGSVAELRKDEAKRQDPEVESGGVARKNPQRQPVIPVSKMGKFGELADSDSEPGEEIASVERFPLELDVSRRDERRKAGKKTAEKGRGVAKVENGRAKKKSGASRRSWIRGIFSFSSLRSNAASWTVNILIGGAVLGIFLLKAAEEYYGLDGDVGGQELARHLSVLDLEHGASESDIRRAYRSLSVKLHPDRNPSCGAVCQQRFQEVASAYEFLMRRERKLKQRNAERVAGGGEGGEAGDEETLRTTSHGVVDFSELAPDEHFFPARDTKHVWSIMIHQDKDDWSQSVYDMWLEASRSMSKYVKFGVIIIRGRNKEILKKLPVNVKLFPAIFLMAGGMAPEQYPLTTRPAAESISRFIADAFPSTVDVVSSAKELRRWLSAAPSSFLPSLSASYKVLVLAGVSAPRAPSLVIKHAAYSNRDSFRFAYFTPSREVYERDAEEIRNLIEVPPAWVSHSEEEKESSAARRGIALSVEHKEPRELQIGATTTFFFFWDEGSGVGLLRREVGGVRSKRFDAAASVSLAVDAFQEAVQPLLFRQNAASLCKDSPRRRVLCLIAVDKETSSEEEENSLRTLDLPYIRKLLATSKNKYMKDNPKKDVESAWRRVLQRARRAEAEGEEADSEQEDVETHSSEEGDEEEEEEGHFDFEVALHVQLARISLTSPPELSALPGLSSDSLFWRFWEEELDEARVFLLDLSEGRVAAMPSIFVDEDKKGVEARRAASLYENLYSLIEEADADGEEERLVFKELPPYCSSSDFGRNCLANAQAPWFASFIEDILEVSIAQIVVAVVILGTGWLLKRRLTAETVLPGLLGMSVCIYLISLLAEMLGPFFSK